MKELTKFEMANVKRTSKSVGIFNKKKERLVAQIQKLQGELEELDKLIELYEAPIKEISGGYTSTEVLSGAMQNEEMGEYEDVIEIEEPIENSNLEASEEVLVENNITMPKEEETSSEEPKTL